MHAGTNGLDATGMKNNTQINFINAGGNVDLSNFNMLSMWVNVKDWQIDKHLKVQFQGTGGWVGDPVNLDAYIDVNFKGEWQRALIPFEDFKFCYAIKKLSHDNASSGKIYAQVNGGAWILLSDDYNSLRDDEVLMTVQSDDDVVLKIESNWQYAPPETLSTGSLCIQYDYLGGTTYGFEDWPLEAGGDEDYDDIIFWIGPFSGDADSVCEIEAHKLRLKAKGSMGAYLDDIELLQGVVKVSAISVCDPDLTADEFGVKATRGKEIKPGIKSAEPDLKPVIKGRGPRKPGIEAEEVIGPPNMKPFPPPRNI